MSFSPIPLDLFLSLSSLSHILWSSKGFLLLFCHTPQLLFVLFLTFHLHKKTNFGYFSFFTEFWTVSLIVDLGFLLVWERKVKDAVTLLFVWSVFQKEGTKKEEQDAARSTQEGFFFLPILRLALYCVEFVIVLWTDPELEFVKKMRNWKLGWLRKGEKLHF